MRSVRSIVRYAMGDLPKASTNKRPTCDLDRWTSLARSVTDHRRSGAAWSRSAALRASARRGLNRRIRGEVGHAVARCVELVRT